MNIEEDGGRKDDEFDIEFEDVEDEDDTDEGKGGEEDDLEIVDDTPEQDRGREPMPKEIVEELENDELEEYSEKVKTRMKQLKKVWHDERRNKEKTQRERDEALSVAQRVLEENRRMRETLRTGEETLIATNTNAAELELASAKEAYRRAYEAGDTEALITAQEKLNSANYVLSRLKEYRPTLQEENYSVEEQNNTGRPSKPDAKTAAWQERNTWFGTDEEMTASALGLHQKLLHQHGTEFVGTDDYWGEIDKTMRRRFPEYFGEDDNGTAGTKQKKAKRSLNVTPASRSRSSRKVVLTKSQVAIARRLGVTPEQYAKELIKQEKQNG